MNARKVSTANWEPISASEAKAHLRILGTSEDTLIDSWIEAARLLCEGYCNICIVETVVEQSEEAIPETELELMYGPGARNVSVVYDDGDLLAVDYAAEDIAKDENYNPVRLDFKTAISSAERVRITYTCGYEDAASVPPLIKQAMLLIIGAFDQNREDHKLNMPTASENLLSQYKVMRWRR